MWQLRGRRFPLSSRRRTMARHQEQHTGSEQHGGVHGPCEGEEPGVALPAGVCGCGSGSLVFVKHDCLAAQRHPNAPWPAAIAGHMRKKSEGMKAGSTCTPPRHRPQHRLFAATAMLVAASSEPVVPANRLFQRTTTRRRSR